MQRGKKGNRNNSRKKKKVKSVPYEELSRTEKFLRKTSLVLFHISEMVVKFSVSFWIPPVYYVLFMVYIRSRVVADSGIMRDILEIPYTLYALTNITGNFLMHRYKDVSLQAYVKKEVPGQYLDKSRGDGFDSDVNFCEKCNMYQVENSWHCKVCDKCVVGRDYHCFVFSQCVTKENKRYYILGLFYASGALIYTSIYALLYNCEEDDFDRLRSIPILGNILFTFVLIYSFMLNLDRYGCWVTSFVLMVNAFLFAIAFVMFVTNMRCVIKRTTYWETKARERGRAVWKDHVFEPPAKHSWLRLAEDVLGERWYLAFFCPFVKSPLPKRALIDNVSVNII